MKSVVGSQSGTTMPVFIRGSEKPRDSAALVIKIADAAATEKNAFLMLLYLSSSGTVPQAAAYA
jgi:hypothetical protein